MGLIELLLEKPREGSGGATNAERTDFQKDWAICKLLDLHRAEANYWLIIECHDDIIVLDSNVNPNKIDFFQVKTKKNLYWTLKSLLSSADGPTSLSYIGRLYHHKLTFKEFVKSMNFVSNSGLKVDLANSSKNGLDLDLIPFHTIHRNGIKSIIKKLREEHKLDYDPSLDDLYFIHYPLNLEEHDSHVKGKLVDFFNGLSGTRKKASYNIKLIYDQLYKIIEKKAENKYKSENDLKKYKSISRADFQSFIEDCGIYIDYKEEWARLESTLRDEQVHWLIRDNLRSKWGRYESDRLDPSNEVLYKARLIINRLLDKHIKPSIKFYNLINVCYLDFCKSSISKMIEDEYYIKAMIMMEYVDRTIG